MAAIIPEGYESHFPEVVAERAICDRIVLDALQQGWSVTVIDGFNGEGEVVLKESRSHADIIGAMFSTGGDTLRFTRVGYKRNRAAVVLVYGNGCDVMHDCSWTAEDILLGASALASKLEAENIA